MFGRKAKRREKIVSDLLDLQREFPDQQRLISDMIMYAEIGKDRNKLEYPGYVEKVRGMCEEHEKTFRTLYESTRRAV